MIQYCRFLPLEEIEKWNEALPACADEFLLFAYDSKFDYEKHIKVLHKYLDYMVSNCNFFKEKDSISLDRMCQAINKLNLLAIKMSAVISVTMNFYASNALIRIHAFPLEINNSDMPLYTQAISFCDAIRVEDRKLEFFCQL